MIITWKEWIKKERRYKEGRRNEDFNKEGGKRWYDKTSIGSDTEVVKTILRRKCSNIFRKCGKIGG